MEDERNWKLLEGDWFGQKVEAPVWFSLSVEDGFLVFSARRDAEAELGDGEAGAFLEGLWKWDVVELFLGAAGSDSYLEFHIVPNGCWWVGEFSGEARERVTEWEDGAGPEGFFTEANRDCEIGWGVTLKVPVSFLEERIGGDVRMWRGNVAGMVRDGGERRYLTANRPPERERPDFHRRELRRELEIRGGG